MALPLHTAKLKMVLERARASGASEFTTVWFATIVARRRQASDQRGRQQREQRRTDQVHRAPAEVRGDKAAGDAPEQNAEEKRAQDSAHGAAAPVARRELHHQRDDDLRVARAHTDDEA